MPVEGKVGICRCLFFFFFIIFFLMHDNLVLEKHFLEAPS